MSGTPAERAGRLLRRRAVLHMLIIAAAHDPGGNWGRMVRLAVSFGGRLDPPVHASEVQELAGLTVGELFDLSKNDAGAAHLRAAVFGPSALPVRPTREGAKPCPTRALTTGSSRNPTAG